MSGGPPVNPSQFSTTQWSVVLDVVRGDPEQAQAALARLCTRYWHPVYAFLRKNGHDPHVAEDLTQGFFHFLLAHDALQSVSREKGRFRSFLLAALTNYLHNERDRQQARKRGGGNHFIPLDQMQAEEFYRHEPAASTDPGRDFDRSWAAMLVRGVLGQLRAEYEQRGRAALFAGLQSFLTGEPQGRDYDQLAGQLGMEPGTVKVALHRARRRFGELLRREVANTVSEPAEVEAEIRHLLATLVE